MHRGVDAGQWESGLRPAALPGAGLGAGAQAWHAFPWVFTFNILNALFLFLL